jgi:hypothetical protein
MSLAVSTIAASALGFVAIRRLMPRVTVTQRTRREHKRP